MFSNSVFSYLFSTGDFLIDIFAKHDYSCNSWKLKHYVFQLNSRRKYVYDASLSSIYNPSFHNCRFFFIFCLVTVLSQIAKIIGQKSGASLLSRLCRVLDAKLITFWFSSVCSSRISITAGPRYPEISEEQSYIHYDRVVPVCVPV